MHFNSAELVLWTRMTSSDILLRVCQKKGTFLVVFYAAIFPEDDFVKQMFQGRKQI